MVKENRRGAEMIFYILGCTYFVYKGLHRDVEARIDEETCEEITWDFVARTAELQERCTFVRDEFSQRSHFQGTELYEERDSIILDAVDLYYYWDMPPSLDACITELSSY